MLAGLRGHGMEEAHHRRGHAAVADPVGGGQPRDETLGVAEPRGVKHVGLRARMLHETGNRLVITDYSNAFNTVQRTAVLTEVAHCVPALTSLVAKCYSTRPADVFSG